MKKFIIGIILFTVLIIGSGAVLLSRTSAKANLEKEKGVKLEIDHDQYNFGTVKLTLGIVEHHYPIKNIGQKDLKIANMASSCACTKVYFKSGDQQSPKAGMKGMTKSTNWVGILKPGENGELVMEFNPNFHGFQGAGKITRSLSFETNDSDHPYVEFNMSGEVIK